MIASTKRTLLMGWASVLVAGCATYRPIATQSPNRYESNGKPEVVSLLARPLFALPPGGDGAKLEAELAKARAEQEADTNNPAKIAK